MKRRKNFNQEDWLDDFVPPKPQSNISKMLLLQIAVAVIMFIVYQIGYQPSVTDNAWFVGIVTSVAMAGRFIANQTNRDFRKSISKAVESDQAEVVKELLSSDKKKPINDISSFNNSIDNENYWQVTTMLLKRGANINLKDRDGNSPLMYLASSGKSDGMRMMLSAYKNHGININLVNKNGQNVLMMCDVLINLDVIRMLLKMGVNIYQKDKQGNNALINAVKNSDLLLVRILVAAANSKYVNMADNRGKTPIIICVEENVKYDVAKFLLRNGADIHQKDWEGNSAFELAKLNQYYGILRFSSEKKPGKIISQNVDQSDFEQKSSGCKSEDKPKIVNTNEKITVPSKKTAEVQNKLAEKKLKKEIEKKKEKEAKEKQDQENKKRKQQRKEEARKRREEEELLNLEKQNLDQKESEKITASDLVLKVEVPVNLPNASFSPISTKGFNDEANNQISNHDIESDLIGDFLLKKTQILSSNEIIYAGGKGSYFYLPYLDLPDKIEPNDVDFELIALDLQKDAEMLKNFAAKLFSVDKRFLKNFKIWKGFGNHEKVESIEFLLPPMIDNINLPLNVIIRDQKYPNLPFKDWVANFDALRLVYKDLTDKKKSAEDTGTKLTFCSHLQGKYKVIKGSGDISLLLKDLKDGQYELNKENYNYRKVEKYRAMGVEFYKKSHKLSRFSKPFVPASQQVSEGYVR